MFVLKNAWGAISKNKARNLAFLIIAIAVSASTVVGLTIIRADEATRTTIYESQHVEAVITPKIGGLGKGKTVKPLTWGDYSKYAEYLNFNAILFDVYYYETAPVTFDKITAVGGSGENLHYVGLSDATVLNKGPYGKVRNIDGKGVDFSSNAPNTIIISQALANANQLKIGSTLKMVDPKNPTVKTDMEVAGIYGTKDSPAKGASANAIYTSYSTFSNGNFSQASQPGDKDRELSVVFQLDNPETYRQFKKTLNNNGLDSNLYDINSPSLKAYEQSTQSLHDEVAKMKPILIAILVMGALLALTWLALHLFARNNEVGMALTIGIAKARIGWQLALETLMVTIPGLLIGIGLGALLCPPAVRSAVSLIGVSQLPAGNVYWTVVGIGTLACVALAIVASCYALFFNTSNLYASANPDSVSSKKTHVSLASSPEEDSSETKEAQ